MKVYLVSDLFSDGDGYTQESPICIFSNKKLAEIFCVNHFIKVQEGIEKGIYYGGIKKKEINDIKNNTNKFIKSKILFLSNNDENYYPNIEHQASDHYFSIREMEVK